MLNTPRLLFLSMQYLRRGLGTVLSYALGLSGQT